MQLNINLSGAEKNIIIIKKHSRMKTKILILLLIVISILQAVAQDTKSQILRDSIQSKTLGRNVSYTIYLPEDCSASDKEFPVLYLLHGYGDDNMGWVDQGRIDKVADEMARHDSLSPMILVIPDAKRSWYINGLKDNYEDFFINEFIPHIESAYKCKTTPKSRSIAGVSMGGYGALLYSLKYPKLFNACCVMSPAILTEFELKYMSDEIYSMFGESFGEKNSNLWKEYNVLEIIKKKDTTTDPLPLFYIDCGDNDFLYRGNAYLHIAMRDKKIDHYMIMRHGEHNWDYWIPAIPEILKFASTNMK